jgi:hypothetical protein
VRKILAIDDMRKLNFIFLVAIIGCSSMAPLENSSAEHATAATPEVAAILRAAKNNASDDPSRWSSEGTTVVFAGQLVKGDCQRFKSHLNSNMTALRVNSTGGDAFEGLCIAREMTHQKFEQTIVDGVCVSSCANYLFLGSRRRLIKSGFVGYHGNITALLKRDPSNMEIRKQLTDAKVDPKEIERIVVDFTVQRRSNSVMEQEFLVKIGVSQALFERTQNPDKGAGAGKNFTFLLPSPSTFARYGILEVTGEQNFEMGQAMGMNNLLQ